VTDRPVADPLLAVDGLTVGYGSVLALRDVSLEVASGEIVAALGPNGAGKTTLLRTLAGALKPRSGSVRFDGSSIAGMGPEAVVRRGIALIPEGRHVFPKLTVQENLTIGGITRSDREELRADAQRWLERFPILGERSRQRDLLIEHLHLIRDKFGYISGAHLAALAAEMRLAQAEVYEVATFYAHFDVVKEGETPPAPVTVRVCDSLSCAMAGADRLLKDLPKTLGPDVRVVRAPCMGACDHAPVCAVGHVQVNKATDESVKKIAYPTTHAHALHPGTDSSITWRPAAIACWPRPSPASAPATS